MLLGLLGLLPFGLVGGKGCLMLVLLGMIWLSWLYKAVSLVKIVSFIKTRHWPSEVVDIGLGGVSHVELIIYALWAGERVGLEMAVSNYRRLGRPMSVPVVPVRQAWKCGKLVGFLSPHGSPRGLGGLMPCFTGANHCRLRHNGWEKVVMESLTVPRKRLLSQAPTSS